MNILCQLSVALGFTSAVIVIFQRLLSFILTVEKASYVNKHYGAQNKIQDRALENPTLGGNFLLLEPGLIMLIFSFIFFYYYLFIYYFYVFKI